MLQAMEVNHQNGFDLGVVVRIVAGEQRYAAAVEEPEAGCRIAHPLANEAREDERKDVDAGTSADRRGVRLVARDEARPTDHVERRIGPHGAQERLDLLGAVLAVGIDLDRVVVAALECEHESRLDSSADSKVERVAQHHRSGPLATSLVPSVEPSSTTRMSNTDACSWIDVITPATVSASL